MNDIIKIEQLPILKENLISIKGSVIERTSMAMSLAVTEDNRKEIKKVRAELNNELKEYDRQLKEVKKAVIKPYEELAAVYKECVSEPYKKADEQLGSGIKEIENRLKAEKEEEVKKYFEEYAEYARVDFVTFDKLGLNVTLSASVKSLKEQVAAFIDKVSEEMESLLSMDNKEELYAEYKSNGYNLANAITTVENRHKRIESEKAKLATVMEQKKQEEEAVKKVTEAVVTVEEITPKKNYTMTFNASYEGYSMKLTATSNSKVPFKKLKELLDEGGFKYE